ncbi:MAG: hypothetical protein ACOCSE_05885, partial [Chitinivibrionales bacterium]
DNPFKPHLIARFRIGAYQKSVVMKYLDNLLNWADQLFRMDNMESVNQATQLYVYASEILGEKPELIPSGREEGGLTYNQLAENLGVFSNKMVDLENYIPSPPLKKLKMWRTRRVPSRYYYYNKYAGFSETVETVPKASARLLTIAPAMHYFCIPFNDKLMSYWEKVEDRLFKIRHCMNIKGEKRELALFAPPIDPGMAAKALAAGLSLGDIMGDMQIAKAPYRFSVLIRKAIELCNEVKSFGTELLAAKEKADAEEMANLRKEHEITLLDMVEEIKKERITEAERSLESLEKSKERVEVRYDYYKDIEKISDIEKAEIGLIINAGILGAVGQVITMGSAAVNSIPDIYIGSLIGPMGGALVESKVAGGEKASGSMEKAGTAVTMASNLLNVAADVTGRYASYNRRWDDWKLQEGLAEKEIEEIDKNILGAEIRKEIAQKDLERHKREISQAKQMKELMETKFTNKQLYQWMFDELNKTYKQVYDTAYKLAKSAEAAYRFELGVTDTAFITPEYWDSGKKGLLAGQRLMKSLQQMDASFIENNTRELEITKPVSLKSINPAALLQLRETGECSFKISEFIYDLDFPGHYFRRLKSVSLTIPCITGPYTSISAELTLQSSSIRTSDDLKGGEDYEGDPWNEDYRFHKPQVLMKSIAVSNADQDTGMFEFNFNDERYLPFEGGGAISEWKLTLPDSWKQFDYRSISDVVLHVNYTARKSTKASFKPAVKTAIEEKLNQIPSIISLHQEFPGKFRELIDNGNADGISIKEIHLPYALRNALEETERIQIYVLADQEQGSSPSLNVTIQGTDYGLNNSGTSGAFLYKFSWGDNGSVNPVNDWAISLEGDDLNMESIKDVFIVLNQPESSE